MTSVTVHPNGKYWKAKWRDSQGQPRSKSLGSAAKVSKRAAKLLADRLQAKLNHGFDPQRAPTLAEYCERFLAHRELAEGTIELYEQTIRYLKAFFGQDVKLDRISRTQAADWRAAVASGKLSHINQRQCGPPAEATICRSVRDAKCIFGAATDEDLIEYNPFSRLRSTAPTPDKDWEYVTDQILDKLFAVCPNDSWRLLLALCRWSGLRQGEALRLKWAEVDLEARRLTVRNPGQYQTTKKRTRLVPIEPRLHDLLFEVYMGGPAGERVLDGLKQANLRHQFHIIANRAGVKPWRAWCHTLRKNCETDWAGKLDVHAYTEFFGHSPDVALKCYTRAEARDFEKITGTTEREKGKEPCQSQQQEQKEHHD